MEIERKFLLKNIPEELENVPGIPIWQGYLAEEPVLRVRREGENFWFTAKGRGLLVREELNLPLSRETFEDLAGKTVGGVIEKTRYRLPLGEYTAELDFFHGALEGLSLAEVEFPDEAAANAFLPPSWFGEEVTTDPAYQNVNLRKRC